MPKRSIPAPHRRARTGRAIPVLLLFLTACLTPPPPGPQPLDTFSERITAFATTSTRGELRDQPASQARLRTALPQLREQATVEQLMARLRALEGLNELAGRIERSLEFELENPEHRQIRENYHTPEVQRRVVAAIILGMERGLEQLQGG